VAEASGTAPRIGVDLSRPPPIPEEGIEAAVGVLRSGWIHRYGETVGDASEASMLEVEFAASVGAKYCVAVNSCGCAMFLALRSAGVEPGDKVLMNAFTLAPVPGAVAHAGAIPVLVEITADLVIDLDDLAKKAGASGARYVLLSHMRGHIADMQRLMELCDRIGIVVIEDCAHTMGAGWAGKPTGTFGRVGCFSLQSYKHVNGGEGGLLVTDDEDVAARAILFSGSYMLYRQHRCRPADEVFDRWRGTTPNLSMRMSNLVAAIARPQLTLLAERSRQWNESYGNLEASLSRIPGIDLPERPQAEDYVQSSIQFLIQGLDRTAIEAFLVGCRARGVYVKWFGVAEPKGYTSSANHWGYLDHPTTPRSTAAICERLCDVRIPLGLSADECRIVADVISEELGRQRSAHLGGRRSG
jgi:dTDP-4-amino-4,6-dideoxygalactose transaminase